MKIRFLLFYLFCVCFVVVITGCDKPIAKSKNGGLYKKIMQGKKLSLDDRNRITMAKMHNDSGMDAFRKKRYLEAEMRFQKSIAIIPDYVDAFNNLGRTYYMEGKFGVALTTLKHAVELAEKTEPNNKTILSSIHANIGDVHRQCLRYSEAISAYQTVLTLTPEWPRAHCELGNLYLKQGKLKAALYRFNKTLELDINYSKALLHRVIIYYYLKQYRKAWSDIVELEKRGLDVAPDLKERVLQRIKKQQGKSNFRPAT